MQFTVRHPEHHAIGLVDERAEMVLRYEVEQVADLLGRHGWLGVFRVPGDGDVERLLGSGRDVDLERVDGSLAEGGENVVLNP